MNNVERFYKWEIDYRFTGEDQFVRAADYDALEQQHASALEVLRGVIEKAKTQSRLAINDPEFLRAECVLWCDGGERK